MSWKWFLTIASPRELIEARVLRAEGQVMERTSWLSAPVSPPSLWAGSGHISLPVPPADLNPKPSVAGTTPQRAVFITHVVRADGSSAGTASGVSRGSILVTHILPDSFHWHTLRKASLMKRMEP